MLKYTLNTFPITTPLEKKEGFCQINCRQYQLLNFLRQNLQVSLEAYLTSKCSNFLGKHIAENKEH